MSENTTESEQTPLDEIWQLWDEAVKAKHGNDAFSKAEQFDQFLYKIEDLLVKADKRTDETEPALVSCFTNAITAMDELESELEHRNFEHALIETRKSIKDLKAARDLLLQEK